MRTKRILLGLVVLLTLAAAGCGYGFRGTVSYLPKDIKTVAIPYLENDTSEAGLEITVTDAIIREFNRSKLLRLADLNEADVVLRGKIRSVTTDAVSFQDSRTALQRRAVVNIDAELVRRDNRKLIWRGRGLNVGEDYDVDGNPQVTEENYAAALREVAINLALKVHDGIFENF